MSSKDMFRKEQRFSFRKFSFGLASAVIANVIFGGAIANSPVVHANTTTETAAVATSERTASLSYTINIVDQAGKVVDTQTKTVSVKTTEATASTTAYLTTDLVPSGYALVSGLGQVTVTENATNVFTVQVEEIASEAASTAASESATSTTAASETASTATSESATATSEVATSETATPASETTVKKAERTAYLSYVTQYVNEEKEIVDSKGHLVAVTTTDETAKTQVTVSADENMPAGYELAQEKAAVVLQLVENQTNVLAFAVAKKSEEEEIAESQLSNRDVLTQVTSEADLLADEALRQVAGEQAGNIALETAANETKAAAATANEVLANAAATEAELGAQIDTVRTSTQNLAAEMLKVDADGVLTAQLNTTGQALTITPSSTGAVRPDYANHIRDFATNTGQQVYNNQDFFFGFIGKELTTADSKVSFTAEAADGSTPTLSILNGQKNAIGDSGSRASFGFKDTGVGVLSGTTTIPDAGNGFSWWFKATAGSNTTEKQFTFIPYTVVKTDENPVRKGVTQGVTADEILAKVKSDVTRGDGSTQGPLNAAFEEYFNSTLTARATRTSTTVADDAKAGKQIWHEIKQYVKVAEANGTAVSGGEAVTGSLPTEAGTYNVTVLSTNVHGQTVENTVQVILNAVPTITESGTGSTNPFKNPSAPRKIVYIFGTTVGDTEALTAPNTTAKDAAPFFDTSIAQPVATITDPDSTSIKVNYGDGVSHLNNLGNTMVATDVNGTVVKTTDGTYTNVTLTNGSANIYLGGTYNHGPGGKYTRQLIVSDESGTEVRGNAFYTVSYTDKLADSNPFVVAKGIALTEYNIFNELDLDAKSGYPSDTNPNITVPKSEVTRTIVGYRTVDADGTKGELVENTDVTKFPTNGKNIEVKVKTTNIYGQTVYNWVPVSFYKLAEIDRETVEKYTDYPAPVHAITEVGSTGTVGTVKLEGDLPADFDFANFNLKEGEAAKLAERNLEFVKADAIGQDGTVGIIRPKDGGKVEYTGSGNIEYIFEYTYKEIPDKENPDTTVDKKSDFKYSILFTDTQAPVMTPKSEYIRFVDEEYKVSVPGTDNAFLSTGKINGTLSVLKNGESGRLVSADLGTNTAITSELDPSGVDVSGGADNQGGNSTKFNVNITGTGPSEQGTGDYKLRVGEDNFPAGPRFTGTSKENVSLTDVKVTFVKRAEVTTPVAVVDPANLTAEEKAAVIEQLKKDNADNKRLQDLPDSAFTVNADGTVSVDYSAGNANVDAVTDKVANATVKLADAQKEAKDAIDAKLAEDKAAIEAKRDAAIAEINNTPGLTDDQKKAAIDAVTDTAGNALTDLQTKADDAKKAIDTKTTVAGINDAKTAGEKALDDATVNGEAAIELTKEKELAKADVDNQAKAAIEAIKKNPNLNEDEQAPYIKAIEDAAKEQKAAIDAAKDTAGITDAVNAAKKVNEEQQLAAAKEDAKDKIAEEAAAAKDAIDKNPNLSDAEKTAAKNAVDVAAADANKAIDAATTPAEAQTAEDNGVKAIDAEELAAAKQDAKNKIAEDVKAANAAIESNPNLTKDEKDAAKAAVADEAKKANDAIDAATTPEAVQAKEEEGTKAIAADVLDAAKQDAKNKIAKDVAAAKAAIDDNPNLSEKEKQGFKDAVDAEAVKANEEIDKATTPAAAQEAEEAGTKEIAADVLDAAKQDAKNKIAKDLATVEAAIDANSNLSEAEKTAAKLEAQAKAAEAVANIEKATTPAAVQTLEDAAVKDLANIEIKAAYDDAVKAIEAADNLSTAAKTQALEDLKKARQAAEEAVKNATTADEVAKGALDGLKSIATVEAKAAADDAKEAIAKNSNLTADEKKVYTDAIDAALKATEAKIKDATDADTVDAETVLAQKEIAKQEVAAATADAVEGIEANANLTPEEKAEYKANVAKAAADAEKAIKEATTAADIQSKTFDATQAAAKEEVTADAADAVKGILANDNLSEAEKTAAKEAVEKARDTTLENIEKAKTAADVETATLDAEKANAKAELKAAADDAKKAIDENTNLPKSEKDALKLAIDAEVAAANLEIDNAKTAEEIDTATLATEKTIAKTEVKAAAEDALRAIDENANLTDDEKAKAKADVYVELSKAEKAIDKADTAEAIDNATLVGEKAIAKEELEAAADDAKKAIDANTHLTDAEKKAAKDAVDTELAKAKDAIDAAKTADAVDAATLVGEKAVAKEEIKAAANDAKKAIDANTNLTADEKAAAKKAVDAEVAKANEAIDAAKTADAVDTATLVGEKAVAKEEVKAAADDAKKAIDANDNLTADEKAAAKKAVDAEVAKANDAIDAATKADAVDTATLAGEKAVAKEEVKAAADDAKKAIDENANLTPDEKAAAKKAVDAEVAKANDAIDAAKTADAVDAATLVGEKAVAKEELKAAADDAKKAIDENANLTPDEKQAAKDAVDAELAKANEAIDAAKTADEVDAATLVGEKAVAKEELKAAADDAKKAIDANDNLTADEKAAAKKAVDAEVAKANEAIDAAKTADAVDTATLVGEKAVAKEELKAVADDAKKAIDANDNLTADEKAAAKKAVDDEVAKANDAIDAAKTADAVDTATLVGEKAVAKEELKAAADDAKKAIDENANLTPEEKQAAKAAVDAEVAKANDAIDAAKTADAVDAATLVGEKAVAKEELKAAADDAKKAIDENANLTPEEKQAAKDAIDAEVAKANEAIDAAKTADAVDAATLVGEKAVAKEELKAAADDAKAAIDANTHLTDDEKQAAKDAVDAELAKANDAIDAATTADEVETATLAGEKAVAKEELKAAADDAKKAIDENTNLTPEEKQAAKDAVDAEVAKANDAIDAATTADAVDTATLVGEKAVAKEELKAAAEDAKKAIDANDNLTDAEKQAAKDAVDAEVAKANDAIDAATTADEVETATLAGEKAVAKEELKAAADDAKKAIDANDNLTADEKAAAKKAVDDEVAKANDAIDAATTADAVDTATLVGEKAVAKEEL
ncbi:TPA: DUF1542 domain-containing protein, partial [Streptococcus suis]